MNLTPDKIIFVLPGARASAGKHSLITSIIHASCKNIKVKPGMDAA
ncbi:MAG: hypothetical protein M0P20_07050 [Methanocorpusculum sp.]|nr:hypothetical protein [Methanocorpusculum sp.]MDD3257485.1 hypothetical protein [Methanocorpusculum sp.]MDD4132948.1 hypothetical protein [Methanocorpusculum sp.]